MLQCNMQALEVADCSVARVNEKTSRQRYTAIKHRTACPSCAERNSISKGPQQKYLAGHRIPGNYPLVNRPTDQRWRL